MNRRNDPRGRPGPPRHPAGETQVQPGSIACPPPGAGKWQVCLGACEVGAVLTLQGDLELPLGGRRSALCRRCSPGSLPCPCPCPVSGGMELWSWPAGPPRVPGPRFSGQLTTEIPTARPERWLVLGRIPAAARTRPDGRCLSWAGLCLDLT